MPTSDTASETSLIMSPTVVVTLVVPVSFAEVPPEVSVSFFVVAVVVTFVVADDEGLFVVSPPLPPHEVSETVRRSAAHAAAVLLFIGHAFPEFGFDPYYVSRYIFPELKTIIPET